MGCEALVVSAQRRKDVACQTGTAQRKNDELVRTTALSRFTLGARFILPRVKEVGWTSLQQSGDSGAGAVSDCSLQSE